MICSEIETFLAIVESGSLSRAGKELGLTQSTVSSRLKALENDLGYQLILRGKGDKSLSLTPMGEAFLLAAKKIHALLQGVSAEKLKNPLLRIGIEASVNTFWLPSFYQSLQEHIPQIKIHVRSYPGSQVCDLAEKREIDLGFVFSPNWSPEVDTVLLRKEPFLVMRLPRPGASPAVSCQTLDPQEELCLSWGEGVQSWRQNTWGPSVIPYLSPAAMPCAIRMLKRREQWILVPQLAREYYGGEYLFQRLLESPPDWVCYRITHKQDQSETLRQGLELLDRLFH